MSTNILELGSTSTSDGLLRRNHHRRRPLRHVPAALPAQARAYGASVRSRRRRRRHVVLESLSGRALRFRELDLRLLVLRRAAEGMGVERAFRRATRDAALLQL